MSEPTCDRCGGEVIEEGTVYEEDAASRGLCLRCYEGENPEEARDAERPWC